MTLWSKYLYPQRLWNIFLLVQYMLKGEREGFLIYLGDVMYIPKGTRTVEYVVQEKQQSTDCIIS